MLLRSAIFVSLHSFLYGYALSSLGPCLVDDAKGSLLLDLDLSTFLQQAATAAVILGGFIGSVLSSLPSQRYGPKRTLLATSILWIFGGALCTFVNTASLFIGRFTIGLAVGLSSAIVPVLLSELAHDSNRGVITSLCQLQITVGILFSGLFAYALVENVAHGWRIVLAVPAAIGVLIALTGGFVPDSPSWLVRAGRVEEAKKTLVMLRGDTTTSATASAAAAGVGAASGVDAAGVAVNSLHAPLYSPSAAAAAAGSDADDGDGFSYSAEVEAEFQAILDAVEQEKGLQELSWKEVFSYRTAVMIGFGMMFFQPMSGINAVVFYSSKIFQFAGLKQAILGTVLVGVINVIMTIVSMSLVERAGRRALLLGGTTLCAVALGGLAGVLLAMPDTDGTDKSPSALQGYAAVGGVLLYIIGFAVGMGAVTWVLLSEILLPRVRAKAYSIFVAESWVFNLIIAMTTLSAIKGLGGGGSDDQQRHGVAWLFVIFGAICALGVVFIAKFVPETKGMSSESIHTLLTGQPATSGSGANASAHSHTSTSGRPRSSSGSVV